MSVDMRPPAPRLLLTGSRAWVDVDTIRYALDAALSAYGRQFGREDITLVHGACHLGGADMIADEVWRGWGLPVELHPARRDAAGRLLGPERNAEMVALGAALCLAFPLPGSRGTANCMRLAREAGIPVRVFRPGEWLDPSDLGVLPVTRCEWLGEGQPAASAPTGEVAR